VEEKSKEIPIVAASEVGRAQTKVFNLGVVGPVKSTVNVSRILWKVERYRVIVPYVKADTVRIGT
jgi:hypothetical protein